MSYGFSNTFPPPAGETASSRPPRSTKIVIAGGFGVGKTTFVGSLSDIVPLTTEAAMTRASVGVDNLAATPNKSTTTVAMDFGRVTLHGDLILYLFGTPGQRRFWFMWDELVQGAIGAVVLVDTRRLADSFPSVDFFEDRHLPFIAAVNCFDAVQTHTVDEVREAMSINPNIPIVACDARQRESTKRTLVTLVEFVVRLRTGADAASITTAAW